MHFIELSDQDLVLIQNALNEVLNGLDVDEFETRLGASRLQASQLQQRLETEK